MSDPYTSTLVGFGCTGKGCTLIQALSLSPSSLPEEEKPLGNLPWCVCVCVSHLFFYRYFKQGRGRGGWMEEKRKLKEQSMRDRAEEMKHLPFPPSPPHRDLMLLVPCNCCQPKAAIRVHFFFFPTVLPTGTFCSLPLPPTHTKKKFKPGIFESCVAVK